MLKRILSVTLAILILPVSLGFCSEKFNVILIVVDALRAGHLGCYGYFRDTSPNIDKLAKEGVLFSRAFSHGSKTQVAISSIVTSLYPEIHNVFQLKDTLANKFITLPEILGKNGYATALFGCYELFTFSNFDCRFEESGIGDYKNAEKNASEVNAKAIKWLKQQHSNPFFLFLHYDNTHVPYAPLPPYDSMYSKKVDAATRKFVRSFNWYYDFIQHNHDREIIKVPETFDYLISQYDGEIRQADDQIKELLEALERLKLSQNTLIILTSDHGEAFLEHDCFFHGVNLNDEVIHVPLIMRLPEVMPQDKTINDLVRHIDITPTILDILGIHKGNIMQGHSLIPLLNGQSLTKQFLFSSTRFYARYIKAIRTNKFKFIENHSVVADLYSYELYDLEADPKELNNWFFLN